jgi:hypothetical protein
MPDLITEPHAPAQKAKVDTPTCPGCAHDLTEIKSSQIAIGEVIVQLLWCGNLDCRQLLPLQVVGTVRQNRIAVPQLTITPGRS